LWRFSTAWYGTARFGTTHLWRFSTAFVCRELVSGFGFCQVFSLCVYVQSVSHWIM